MRNRTFTTAGVLATTVLAVLAFGTPAFANTVVPGSATLDCTHATATFEHFPAQPPTTIIAKGLVDGNPWIADATLNGPQGTLSFPIPAAMTAGTGVHTITFIGVQWQFPVPPGHVGAAVLHEVGIGLEISRQCHDPVPPTTVPPTTQPPAQIIPPTVVTAPAPAKPVTSQAITPRPQPTNAPALAFTGAGEVALELAAGVVLIAGGLLLDRRYGPTKRPSLRSGDGR